MPPRAYVPIACSFLLGPSACALGCAPDEGPALSVSTSVQQPIQGGYLDDFDKPVVFIAHVTGSAISMCSGSLIAPNVVLTAQHCVAPTYNDSQGVRCDVTTFGNPYAASELYVTTLTSYSMNTQDYVRGAEVHLPPGDGLCGRDQAIIILQEPIGIEIAQPLVPRVDDPILPGEGYSAVGYGQLSETNTNSGTRYRRDNLTVYCVDDGCPAYATVPPELIGETGICSGDSGGPALDLVGRVFGVASRGSTGCDSPVYGNVQGQGEWIKQTTSYAAGLLGSEPPPWATGWPTDPAYSYPVGGSCNEPTECPSGLCVDHYCTRLCDDRAPCPADHVCAPETGTCQSLGILAAPDPSRSTEQAEGCSITTGPANQDPTKPIPWVVGLSGLWLLSRRRGRR